MCVRGTAAFQLAEAPENMPVWGQLSFGTLLRGHGLSAVAGTREQPCHPQESGQIDEKMKFFLSISRDDEILLVAGPNYYVTCSFH